MIQIVGISVEKMRTQKENLVLKITFNDYVKFTMSRPFFMF